MCVYVELYHDFSTQQTVQFSPSSLFKLSWNFTQDVANFREMWGHVAVTVVGDSSHTNKTTAWFIGSMGGTWWTFLGNLAAIVRPRITATCLPWLSLPSVPMILFHRGIHLKFPRTWKFLQQLEASWPQRFWPIGRGMWELLPLTKILYLCFSI